MNEHAWTEPLPVEIITRLQSLYAAEYRALAKHDTELADRYLMDQLIIESEFDLRLRPLELARYGRQP
jgi:hypothetical protein